MASLELESQPELWNKLPPEILEFILSKLGKHDLLNARLVSHAWSLKVLRMSKFTQLLTQWTIKKYILFNTPIQPRESIIPIHLNFEIELGVLGLLALTSDVESLCQIFGPECVSTLTLTTNDNGHTQENIRQAGLIEFLTLISPGLKTLDFARLNFKIDFLQNQIITFPNLKKLICNTSRCETGRIGPEMAYISIIENSPILEDLTLTHICDLVDWPLKFHQLKSLSLESLMDPKIILDKILASSGPPVLQKLSYGDDLHLPDDQNVVNNILESFSSTLKSLELRNPLPPRDIEVPLIARFPLLPHLEHLGLIYSVGHWLDPEVINFTEEAFPSLKSVELPLGLICAPSLIHSDEQDFYDVRKRPIRIEFPNLIHIILRVGLPISSGGPEYWNDKLEHLQALFPTPSKLSLVNAGGHDCVNILLDCIMKTDWSKNIEDFGMIGFRQDYLGQFIDQLGLNPRMVLEECDPMFVSAMNREFRKNMNRMGMECGETVVSSGQTILTRENHLDSYKMTNITTIKLELIFGPFDRDRDYFHYWSAIASTPNLLSIGKHFPQLRMIEISELLFHQVDKSIRSGQILEFKSTFPHVNLYLT